MTNDKNKILKMNSISIVTVKAGKDLEDSVDSIDLAYLKVNQVSFEQNFKALIGHYKGNESERSPLRM